jgi:hypothetical protein
MRRQFALNGLTRIVSLVRLSCLLPLAFTAGCGLGQDDHGCPADQPCVEVAVVRGSAVDLSVVPGDDGNDLIYLHAPLQLVGGGRCYQVPDDLFASANGGPPVPVGVSYDSGDAIVLFDDGCPPDQHVGAVFSVPAGADPITITFARGGIQASLTVTRAPRPPVDFVFSTTTVARGETFSADLSTSGAAPSAGEGCWTGYLSWDSNERGMYLNVSPETTASGLRLGLALSEHAPASEVPPGGTHLTLSTTCDTEPSVSCPGFRGCTVHEGGRTFGPFAIQLL